MKKIVTPKRYRVNLLDVTKAFLIAVLTPMLVLIQNSIDAGVFTVNWKPLLMTGIGGGLAYLIKNFFTPSQVITKNSDNEKTD